MCHLYEHKLYQRFKLRDKRKTQQSMLPGSNLCSNSKNIRQRV